MDFVVQSILENVELEQEDTEPKDVIQIQDKDFIENESKPRWKQSCCSNS